MPAPTLSSLGLNWSMVQSATAPGDSANPVIKLTFTTGAVFWLKAAPGGARIAFAEQAMNRMGFTNVGSQVLDPSQLEAFARSSRARAPEILALVAKMRERLRKGQDLILSAHVGGNGTYEANVLDGFDGTKAHFRQLGHRHALMMQNPNAQESLARMIAVDLIVGNFDRASKYGGDDHGHFHLGNFIYDAASQGFLPIDNDTLAPSLHHHDQVSYVDDIGRSRHRAPTRLDLYRTAILGGALLENRDLYATEFQADMSGMLGEDAVERIHMVIKGRWGGTWESQNLAPEDAELLHQAAVAIAPLVRTEMRRLVQELKNPTAGEASLLKTMKACEAVDGMNYSVLKVRSRFAQLMTMADAPPSTEDTVRHALSYGMYRDWKQDLLKLVARPLPDYPVPNVQLAKHSSSDKAARTMNTVFGKIGFLKLDQNEVLAKALAKGIKSKLRDKKQALDYQALKNDYETQLRGVLDTDNRIVKAKILTIGVLVRNELDQFVTIFTELINAHPHQAVVAQLYAKAFLKNGNDARLQALIGAYELIVAQLKRQLMNPHVQPLKSGDVAVIGVGMGQSALEDLCRNCRMLYNQLRTTAAG